MKVKLTGSCSFTNKDQTKIDIGLANKYIGIGCKGSSTHQYMLDFKNHANCDEYDRDDRVFISINGNRRNRVKLDDIKKYIEYAIEDGVTVFITDNEKNATTAYNMCGEGELAQYLQSLGFVRTDCETYGEWNLERCNGL